MIQPFNLSQGQYCNTGLLAYFVCFDASRTYNLRNYVLFQKTYSIGQSGPQPCPYPRHLSVIAGLLMGQSLGPVLPTLAPSEGSCAGLTKEAFCSELVGTLASYKNLFPLKVETHESERERDSTVVCN